MPAFRVTDVNARFLKSLEPVDNRVTMNAELGGRLAETTGAEDRFQGRTLLRGPGSVPLGQLAE